MRKLWNWLVKMTLFSWLSKSSRIIAELKTKRKTVSEWLRSSVNKGERPEVRGKQLVGMDNNKMKSPGQCAQWLNIDL